MLVKALTQLEDDSVEELDAFRLPMLSKVIDHGKIVQHWIDRGFAVGSLEVDAFGGESFWISLSDNGRLEAHRIIKKENRRAFIERFNSVGWSAITAAASVIAAFAAIAAAYFAYLAIGTK